MDLNKNDLNKNDDAVGLYTRDDMYTKKTLFSNTL